MERARKLGYIVNMGPELEFFLFRRDEDGKIAPLPHDLAGYFDFSTDLAQEVRQDMVDALEAFGIRVEAAHHEVAAGQHEIDFEYADALQTADNAITFKFTLKAIAQQHGLYATFMPKPILGINGSGMHTHQSLFSIAEGAQRLRRRRSAVRAVATLAKSYMAGILAHARGMIAVLAPLVNSYKRLVPGYEAPTYLTWGRTNRSALIRVPMVSPGKSIEGTRVEVRCPDPSSNTYLAFAAMIAAGLDGVEKGLTLSEPVEESLFEMDAARIAAQGDQGAAGHARRGARRAVARTRSSARPSATTSSTTSSRPSAPSGTSTGRRSRTGRSTATSRSSRPSPAPTAPPARSFTDAGLRAGVADSGWPIPGADPQSRRRRPSTTTSTIRAMSASDGVEPVARRWLRVAPTMRSKGSVGSMSVR